MLSNFPGGPGYFKSGQVRVEDLWESPQEQAMLASIMLDVGYGVLVPGMVLAMKRTAASGVGNRVHVPYVPAVYDAMVTNPYMLAGRIFLTADAADGATVVYVPIEDSYRLSVGDELIVADDGTTTPENLGPITAIDRTTSAIFAGVTATYPITASGGFTTSNTACCYPNGNPSALLASDFGAAAKQVDTLTLTGTSGTATISGAGDLTRTATFDTDLTTTAGNFVTAYASDYLGQDIVLTSSGADLVFTALVAGVGFTSPSIANATTDLAGSVVNTTANSTGKNAVVANANAVGLKVGQTLVIVDDDSDAVNIGTITSITKGSTNTTIAVSNVPTGTFTTDADAMIYVYTPTMQTAVCILGRERNTGYGKLASANTAYGQGIFKNAKLKRAALGNIDADAVNALGAKEFAGYLMV